MSCMEWLKDAVFYQVYPQSFYDTNADGIGDIPGIIEKLDYIRDLGCNAVWVNPCFDSPFEDAGYDIANFYKVAPRYGTNADLRRLFKAAHQKGMKVLLDLVPAHTSTEHPWFQASARPEKNRYTNWYVWTDSVWTKQKGDLTLIRGKSQRPACYVPNFFATQPALNFGFAEPEHPWQLPVDHPDVQAVQDEIMNIFRYWLDAGVDGFRVDMAFSIVKNDPGWKETTRYWRRVREMFDRDYPQAALLSEWSTPTAAINAGFHVDFMIQINDFVYHHLFRREGWRNHWKKCDGDSFFEKKGQGDITAFLNPFLNYWKRTRHKGFICLPTGNHDITRLSYGRDARQVEIAYAFLMTMPSLPLIYYGDEIGMKYQEGLESKEGGYERTGSRTPMQWTRGRNAGFSKASKKDLYLPVDPSSSAPNVESQLARRDSLLNRIRRLIELRRSAEAFGPRGQLEILYMKPGRYPLIYLRRKGRRQFVIALNPADRPVSANILLPACEKIEKKIGLGQIDFAQTGSRGRFQMGPVSYGIFEV